MSNYKDSPTYEDPSKSQEVTSNQPPPDSAPATSSNTNSTTWTVIVVCLAIALVFGALHYQGIFSSGPQPLVTYNSASPGASPSAATVGTPATSATPAQGAMPPPSNTNGGQGSTY